MHFTSTRGCKNKTTPSQAIIKGLSEDGGLFIPNDFPNLTQEIPNLTNLSYQELALIIFKNYLVDFTENELRHCINSAYDDKFDTKDICSIKKINKDYFLELYHGPTCAFKDIALTILPLLMIQSMKKNNINKEVVILTATSGDTGKAALEGFKDVPNTKVIVLFPENGVSPIQKLQMLSQDGKNTFVISIKGNFDDAQNAVKYIFNNEDFVNELSDKGYILSSANSINIGRLIPQIVYYFYTYCQLVKNKEINIYDKINFVVPTGNFGDILAGYYAKKMGLPINKLICSSNENNVLYDFFSTGIYDKNRELKLTISPSMDILFSSNLERLLYDISKHDCTKVNELINKLNSDGNYKIDNYMKENLKDFRGYFATEDEVKNSIYDLFNRYNYLIDTHTGVAYACYKKYKQESNDNTKSVIFSTASPYKFSDDVLKALGANLIVESNISSINTLSSVTNTAIPAPISKLKSAKLIHNITSEKKYIIENIKNILKV